jgi:hypothetical protein
MNQHHADLLRMRDTLEHLHLCQQQLEYSEEADSFGFLTDTMLRDLESCRRLCQKLRRQQTMAAVA